MAADAKRIKALLAKKKKAMQTGLKEDKAEHKQAAKTKDLLKKLAK